MSRRPYPHLTLPEGGQWAAAPLLWPANVGDYVIAVFNGNTHVASRSKILKIGRTNVHIEGDGQTPWSLRVNPNGHTASGMTGSGYSISCCTHAWIGIEAETAALVDIIRGTAFGKLPLSALGAIVNIINNQGGN
jgi:hypothetical protein